MKTIDRIIGFVLLVISIVFYMINKTYPENVQDYTGALFILLGLSSLYLMIGKENKLYVKKFNKKAENINFKNIFIVLIALLFYVISIILIGYFPSTVIFITGLLILLNMKNWKIILITNIFFMVIVYMLFIVFLNLQLPTGILFKG